MTLKDIVTELNKPQAMTEDIVERLKAEADIARRAINITNSLWQSSEKECAELRAYNEQLKTENAELRKLNIERCKPEGYREEQVADWLLARGYTVEPKS